jgi:ABC-type uncharacterized transport system permease subunit
MARVCAAIAVVASLLGTAALLYATGGGPGIAGYVSESGVAGAPHALVYRLALLAFVVATAATALALRTPAPLAAAVLALAAPFLLVSTAARCSTGCPLPPFQRPTLGDLVHAGASIVAIGLCALAMLAAAWRATDRRLRRVSGWTAAVTVPVLFAMAVGLLTVGHSPFTGIVERLSLVGCLSWLVAVSGLGLRPPHRRVAGV